MNFTSPTHYCSSLFLSVHRLVVQGERTIAKVFLLIAVREEREKEEEEEGEENIV
jgi:hypothetical protein